MNFPVDLRTQLQHFYPSAEVLTITAVHGGDINQAYQIQTSIGKFFVKMNQAKTYPGMFEAEAKGLELLSQCESLHIPKPLFFGEDAAVSWLVMEWMETTTESQTYWENLGAGLADLHQITSDEFGLDHANYIGSLTQHNKWHKDWVSYFVEERLEPQVRMARDAGEMDAGTTKNFERLYTQLENIFPVEKPALLHGDLWNGNVCCIGNNQAAVFDPAVYYGHREMDLAMTKLFGGYNQIFYDTYINRHPLLPDWSERVPVYNLYPLLVHLNLFGGSYLHSVQSIVNKF